MINMKINLLLSDYCKETSDEHKILIKIRNMLESVDCFGYIMIDFEDEKIIKEESNNILVALDDTYSNFFSSCKIIKDSLVILHNLRLKCCNENDELC